MEKSTNPAPLNNRGSGSIQLVADDVAYTPIPQFYAGRSIFITGGTGFMGKVLVEKLLRSCPDIKNIYLLIRTKRGKAVSTRLTELFNVPLFDTLRRENPKQLNKVIPISGDITMEELGISKSDQAMLCRNVSIVFHSAATVRFDEKLKLSVVINMLGTKRLIELCHRMVSLDALIHVSTAYSNCDRAEVSEIIYDAPYKPDDIISLVNLLPEDMLDNLTPSLIGKLPNTYTFTKALAEHVLLKEAGNIPVAIVRPSIVISSAKEPFAGWIDNFNGPLGLVCAMSRGLLRTMMCEREGVANVIPVDTVINLMITVAWRTATTKSDSNPSIYNVCSGMYQPITWGELNKFALIQAHQNPVEGCLWYPLWYLSRNRPLNNTYGFLVHYIPAHIFDTVSRLTGKKPFMVSIQNKISKAVECLEYFATNQWRFKDDNVHALLSQMSRNDLDTFDFDVRTIDWDKYMERCMLGVREFLFKQQPDSLPESRKRMKRLYYLHHLTKFLTGTITASVLIAYWIRLYDS